MADVTNPQVVDSVTGTNFKVLGDVPASAAGIVYQSVAQAISMGIQNAVSSQQRANEIANMAMAAVLKDMASVDPAEAVSLAKTMSAPTDLPAMLSQLGAALGAVQQLVKTEQSTPPETALK